MTELTAGESQYTRFGLAIDRLNADAGEDLRYLPRQMTKGVDLPGEDYWLLNDDKLVWPSRTPSTSLDACAWTAFRLETRDRYLDDAAIIPALSVVTSWSAMATPGCSSWLGRLR